MENKKVVILSSEESFLNNYGAVLQGYALSEVIKELGYNPEFVRYKAGRFTEDNKNEYIMITKWKVFEIKRKIKQLMSLEKNEYCKEIKSRENLFRKFQEDFLRFSNKKRISWITLRKKYPKAYAYVCGSDQIWNPYFKGGKNDPGYFLHFAPKNSRKIAYAPSFGCDDLPLDAQKTIKKYLEDFKGISVREKSGIGIIKKYCNREAKLVLDPTLLRTSEEWERIATLPENIPNKYILCYRFADSENTKHSIDIISERLGLPVISLPLSQTSLKDTYKMIFNAGPQEFLGLIKNASLVCTDSFHATVFSIIFKTPVAVYLREGYSTGNSMNSRIFSLLEMLGLEHLLQDKNKEVNIDVCLGENYDNAHCLLNELRIDSKKYLETALND